MCLTAVRYACFPQRSSLLVVNVLRMSDPLPLALWLVEVQISIFKCLLVVMGW